MESDFHDEEFPVNADGAPKQSTQPDFDLVVRGERILTTAGIVAREIGIRDGRVVAIEPLGSGLGGAEIIELTDEQVMIPGLVDTHVHVNEPGRTEWEGFDSATRAAAAGGVTTLIDMPLNSIPPTVNVDALNAKRAACLLYTSPSPRDGLLSRMPSSA